MCMSQYLGTDTKLCRTETSLLASLSTAGKRDPMDWSYYRFLDEYRVKLEPVDDDGILHSLVVMVRERQSLSLHLLNIFRIAG